MRWNSEYMIVGNIDGKVFTIGLWPRGEGRFGSLYAGGKPRLLELSKVLRDVDGTRRCELALDADVPHGGLVRLVVLRS